MISDFIIREQMDIQNYCQMFFDFQNAISRTQLISMCAEPVFVDFPKNLPNDAKQQIYPAFKGLVDAFSVIMKQHAVNNIEGVVSKPVSIAIDTSAKVPHIQLVMSQILSGNSKIAPDFTNVLRTQEIVMMVAHFDAFTVDTLRAMCLRNPNLLRRNKQMSWSDIVVGLDQNDLLDTMIEKYCFEFGHNSIKERILYLQKDYNLVPIITQEQLEEIDNAEKIRNLIVHNGGRASKEYLTRSKRTDINVGDVLSIDSEYARELGWLVLILASDLLRSVGENFFKATESDFHGVPKRG